MDKIQERISRAWKESKSWITEFDGTPFQAIFPKVAMEILPHSFETLSKDSANFRVSIYGGESGGEPQFVGPETIQLNVARLLKDEISGLDANYTANLPGLDLDVHLIVHTVARDRVDLELVWWSDQVFPDDTDHQAMFQTVMSYFIFLQDLFKAPKVYVGPESLEDPDEDTPWVEL